MSYQCPGRDRSTWRPEDTHEVPCPRCGTIVEFMKDDFSRKCPKCGVGFGDPKKDMGCVRWCQFAADCLGVSDPRLLKEAIERAGKASKG